MLCLCSVCKLQFDNFTPLTDDFCTSYYNSLLSNLLNYVGNSETVLTKKNKQSCFPDKWLREEVGVEGWAYNMSKYDARFSSSFLLTLNITTP